MITHDKRKYASTLTEFAINALPEGSPLRTTYILFAQQPQEIFRTSGLLYCGN